MATLTPAQRQMADAMLAGTFDKLDTQGRVLPAESVSQMYAGTYPPAAASPAMRGVPSGQMQAIRDVPQSAYMRPANPAINRPGMPANTQFADTGNWGRATPSMTGYLPLNSPSGAPVNPAVLAAAQQSAGVPMPRQRPWYAPTAIDMAAINAQQVGANPGMGGAMIGNGQMAPGIPPQGPPPAGIAPTWWAGSPVNKGVGSVADPARGLSASQPVPSYQQRLSPAFAGLSPAQAYDAANIADQIRAATAQQGATGQTGVYNYNNGVRGSTVTGGSPAQAYAAAVSRNNSRSGTTSSGQSKTASDGTSWAANF